MNPIRRRRLGGVLRDLVPPVQFRTFNGTSNALKSAATIDLSAVSTVSVAFWLWWDTFANNDKLALELSSNYNLVTTGFVLDPNGGSGPSTGLMQVAVLGDVGSNSSVFTRPTAAAWHFYVLIFDKSQVTPETFLYIDGILQSGTNNATSNNTNNFGNLTLNVMARDATSLFGAGRMARLALWPGVTLSPAEITSLYQGVPVRQIRPSAFPYYWPLTGTASPELGADSHSINMTVF